MERPQQKNAQYFLEKLIGYNSVSANSNLDLIDFTEDYLTELGFRCERISNPEGTKANLWASIGPLDTEGYILSGHTDVVPVDGQDWQTDPFQMVEKDGKLFGRGSCDMKGFLACVLAKAPAIAKANLQVPFHLAFSFDEEVGCLGVRYLLEALQAKQFKAKACFIGEPTEMQVVVAHKSKASYRAVFSGVSCHSSLAPQGLNAVSYAAKLVAKLDSMAAQMAAGRQDTLYDLPFSTAHVGVFNGGTALNIVPDQAEVVFEFRVLPEENLHAYVEEIKKYAFDVLLPEMKQKHQDAGIEIIPYSEIPGLNTRGDAEVVTLAKQLCGRNDHAKVAYGTEGGLFQSMLDIPVVVVGPGAIEQAHKPDEFIKISELEKCEAFLDRLLAKACA
ncbi:acetylornithine deacetylase [Polycladidibacter stylochi]|uniref:acetylornithine deacetylase n=1 Tax=Polycladidibacter stylochi TaxID=1807766 RepID=UPI000837402C|nr:acetylornithine deacetylase [Pseudovibrio stylochi]